MESTRSDRASELSPRELSQLRARLERSRDELLARLQNERQAALQAESLSEPIDAAELTREQDDGALFAGRDQALLSDIQHALAKFETGTYGRSETSGRPIGFRRLLAIPWTRITADEAEAN